MEEPIENILGSRFNKAKFVSYLQNNPSEFDKTLQIALSDLQPQAWRAAWVIGHCMSKNDVRIQPYVKPFIEFLNKAKDGHQRELLKILIRMEIDEDLEGILFDQCATIWEDISKSPSVRVVAFRFMAQVAKNYPELKNEIEFFCQDHYVDSLSPGIKNSLKKLMKSAKLV